MVHLSEKLNILVTPKSRDKFKDPIFSELPLGATIYGIKKNIELNRSFIDLFSKPDTLRNFEKHISDGNFNDSYLVVRNDEDDKIQVIYATTEHEINELKNKYKSEL